MEGKFKTSSRPRSVKFGQAISFAAILLGALGGCGSRTPLPYPNFSQGLDSESETRESAGALSEYFAASSDFEENLGLHKILLSKSNYTPSEQGIIEKAASEPLRRIKAALQKGCSIPYEPFESRDASKGRAAWRMLAKVMVWRVEAACETHSYEDGIETAVLATKFGFDLSAGLPNDASLGLLTVDEVREAIAPSLGNMSVRQLELLAKSMKTVYLNRPSMAACFDDAEKDSLHQVQFVQDTFRTEDYVGMSKKMGTVAKEIVPTLKELHQQSDQRRVAFFEGFAQLAKEDSERVKKQAQMSVAERVKQDADAADNERNLGQAATSANGEKPWRKIAKRVLGVGKPILSMSDATNARTKLLILESELIIRLKSNGKTPPDLSKFSKLISTDPYSGQTFIYRTDGSDFKIYSVGEDLIDNDGETDETFSSPDLKLERTGH